MEQVLKLVFENIENYCHTLKIIIFPNERIEIFMGLSPGISETSKVLLEIDKTPPFGLMIGDWRLLIEKPLDRIGLLIYQNHQQSSNSPREIGCKLCLSHELFPLISRGEPPGGSGSGIQWVT